MRIPFFFFSLLLAVGSPLVCTAGPTSADCKGWLTREFYSSASQADVEYCVRAGRSVAERTDIGETPLHLAVATASDTEAVLELLIRGADVSLTTSKNYTPLDTASAEGESPAIISLLLAWGADIGVRSSADACRLPLRTCAETALHLAARRSSGVDVMAALIAAGGEVDGLNGKLRTPLHLAAGNAGLDEVRLLIQAGADVSAEDETGRTPLHAVARRPDASPEVISVLLEAGASPDARADEDVTPLSLATAYTDVPAVFGLLLKASSAPCFEDVRGRSALSLHKRNPTLEKDASYWDLHERCAE